MKQNINHLQKLIDSRKKKEAVIKFLFFLISAISIVTIVFIAFTLISESWPFFKQISFKEFFLGTEWTPLFENPRFGIWPLISGTLTTTWIAMMIAFPTGIFLAAFLSEFSSQWVRELAKPILEILAGIPTVIYGYFALLYVTPFFQKIIPNLPGFNMFSAGLMIGIMIAPYFTSLVEDALASVSLELREGSLALGASKVETTFYVLFPQIKSQLVAAFILAISRALGETMIVLIAAGSMAVLNWNPFATGQTLTAFIAQVSLGDTPHGSIAYQAMYAVAFILFVITLFLNSISFRIREKRI